MDDLHILLQNKKIRLNLILITLLVLLLPIGILLVRQAQVYFSRAEAKFIEIAEGNCVTVRKGVKVLTCADVPLKLINPSLKPSSTPTPTPTGSGSASPTPSGGSTTPTPSGGSVGPPRIISVAQFQNNIQAALDSIKSSGGAVYLPAGTYTVPEKVRVYSNITLFGDGMDRTIIEMAPGVKDDLVANDSTKGQENIVIRDLTLKGPGMGNYNSGNCCNGVPYGLKLENLNKSFVINVAVDNFPSHGIYIGYKIKSGQPQGVRNTRITGCRANNNGAVGIYLVDTDNVVVDNCIVQNNGSIQPIDGITAGPDNGNIVRNSKILSNNVTNNKGNGIGLASCQETHKDAPVYDNAVCNNDADPNDFAALRQHKCNAGVRGNIFIGNQDGGEFDNLGNGEIKTQPASACDIPSTMTLPPAPQKPSASIAAPFLSWINKLLPNLSVFAQDCVPGNPFHPCTTPTPTPTPTPASTASPTPAGSPSPTSEPTEDPQTPSAPPSPGVYAYRLSESEADLEKAEWKPFGLNPNSNSATDSAKIAVTNFKLSDETPGAKQIWAEFRDLTGKTIKDHITFSLAEKDPEITSLNCTYDLARQNVKIAVSGKRFGQIQGNVVAGTNLTANDAKTTNSGNDILNWSPEEMTFLFKSGNSILESGQSLKVGLIREDDARSTLEYCLVDQSSISLGARVFCREPGKFDLDNVKVSIFYNPDDSKSNQKLSKVDETVTISKDGFVQGLKTKLQSGKNYAISIQAPNSLRRNADFTASDGTTIINSEDGGSFILPIGDIAPVTGLDGQINSLDRSEIARQWRILGENAKKTTGDFNRDGKVNSIDWACMRYDFNSEDDPLPTAVSVSKSRQDSRGNDSTITNTIISE